MRLVQRLRQHKRRSKRFGALAGMIFPHCGLEHATGPAVCSDTHHWTRAERDAWREEVQRRSPGLHFASSNEVIASRFGHKSARW